MKNHKTLFGIACIVIAVLLSVMAVFKLLKQHNNEQIYEEISESSVDISDSSIDTIEKSIFDEDTSNETLYISSVDFDKLQKTNPDVYAWIEIPDTDVTYPILQSATDDSYYLNHTIDGTEGLPGSIYTSNANSKDFSDFNTVIYGHNMRVGTMFGALKNFRDESYFEEHQTINIYTPEQKLTYRIYAAVVYDDRLILDSFDFSTIEGKQEFINSLTENRDLNSHYRTDMIPTADDKLITLSTCVGGQPNNRYLIVACLQNEY